MKVYRVKDWNDHYENNRTRTMDVMRWVPIPNKFDGDGYTELVAGQDGAALYGCWVAIIGVAGRCHERGTLLRDNKTPHTAETISRLTRLPTALIQATLEKTASAEVGWMEVVEIEGNAPTCQAGDKKVSGTCQATDEEGKEGIEGKNSIHTAPVVLASRFAIPTTEKEAVEWAGAAGVPPDFSKMLYHQCEGRGWVDGSGQAIQMWSSYAKNRYLKEAFNKPPAGLNGNGNAHSYGAKAELEARIARHPGNPNFKGHNAKTVTPAQTAEYRKLREELNGAR